MEFDILELPQHRISLVDFNSMFQEKAPVILSDLKQYGLIGEIKTFKITRPIKQIFYHHIIKLLCDNNLDLPEQSKHIYYCVPDMFRSSLDYYFTPKDVDNLVFSILLTVESKLPIRLYEGSSKMIFSTLIHESRKKSGEFQDILEVLKGIRDKDFTKYTFSRIKDFVKRNKLTYLSEQYFADIKIGKLLLH